MADLIEGTYVTGARVICPGCNFTPWVGGSAEGTDSEDNIDLVFQQSSEQSILSVCGLDN